MPNVNEIAIEELMARVSFKWPETARDYIQIVQLVYQALRGISSGYGMQRIGWKWENDGTWTNDYLALPNDIIGIEDIWHNGSIMVKKTDSSKKGLNADEYYTDGPYLHFQEDTRLERVQAIVIRAKTNTNGSLVMAEDDADYVENYVLWQLYETAYVLEQEINKARLLQEKSMTFKAEMLAQRSIARGKRNEQTDTQIELAQYEWHNMFRNNRIRKTWLSQPSA